jgi:hypothetical protein
VAKQAGRIRVEGFLLCHRDDAIVPCSLQVAARIPVYNRESQSPSARTLIPLSGPVSSHNLLETMSPFYNRKKAITLAPDQSASSASALHASDLSGSGFPGIPGQDSESGDGQTDNDPRLTSFMPSAFGRRSGITSYSYVLTDYIVCKSQAHNPRSQQTSQLSIPRLYRFWVLALRATSFSMLC